MRPISPTSILCRIWSISFVDADPQDQRTFTADSWLARHQPPWKLFSLCYGTARMSQLQSHVPEDLIFYLIAYLRLTAGL